MRWRPNVVGRSGRASSPTRSFAPMNTNAVPAPSSDQIDAAFAAVFAEIEPPRDARKRSQADRLAPYRRAVMKQRRRGLTWKQIAVAMADPRIGVKVTEKALRQTFGAKPADASAATAAAVSADVRAAVSADR